MNANSTNHKYGKKTDVKIERNLVKPPNSRREKNAGSYVCIVADKDDEL